MAQPVRESARDRHSDQRRGVNDPLAAVQEGGREADPQCDRLQVQRTRETGTTANQRATGRRVYHGRARSGVLIMADQDQDLEETKAALLEVLRSDEGRELVREALEAIRLEETETGRYRSNRKRRVV